MVTYKNITIPKRGGGTRKQRVKVLASGKYKFVKNIVKRVTRKTTRKKRKKSNPIRRRTNLARKKKRRSGKSLTTTAFKFIRLGALVAPAAYEAMSTASPEDKVKNAMAWYTGFDMKTGTWHPEYLLRGWGAYLGACLATYGIPKVSGILRRL